MGHELLGGKEPASENELRELHDANYNYLVNRGELFLEWEDRIRNYEYNTDGLPILVHPARLAITIQGDEIRTLLPKAALILGIGDIFQLNYNLPYYQRLEDKDELCYSSAASTIYTSSLEGPIQPVVAFDIELDPETGSFSGSKSLHDFKAPVTEDLVEYESPISHDECAAILEIIDRFNCNLESDLE